jgi:hypothetical protein
MCSCVKNYKSDCESTKVSMIQACGAAIDPDHAISECQNCQEWLAHPVQSKKPHIEFVDAEERSPEKDGFYFIVNHCDKKKTYNYNAWNVWWDEDENRAICPHCERFKWLNITWKF